MESTRVPFVTSFFRSQIASITATAVDYITFFVLEAIFGVYYPIASAIGSVLGAIVNFSMGRWWSFKSKDHRWVRQALKYAVVSLSSAVLNTWGLIVFVERLGFDAYLSKVMVSITVGILWNFPLFRYFVFKK